jgi:hypothetical protein
MTMSTGQAQGWITVGAVATAGIYGYRRIADPATTKGNLKAVAGGAATPVPTGQFVTAWGCTWLVVSILAEADPGLGGAFALLILTADFLTNANVLFTDVTTAETVSAGVKGKGTAAHPVSAATTAAAAQPGLAAGPLSPELPGNFNLEPSTLN